MKKNICLFLFLIIFLNQSLLGCNDMHKNLSDQYIANNCLNQLLDAIENEDINQVRSLFSKKVLLEMLEFDNSVIDLFAFYQGHAEEFDGQCPLYTDYKRDNEKETKFIFASYDIETNINVYRVAIQYCAVDNCNPNNVGLWSISIILFEDDPSPGHTYWGNVGNILGITVDGKNIE